MVLPLFSPPSVLSRLTSIFLGFAPPFLLLSIGYAVMVLPFAVVHNILVCVVSLKSWNMKIIFHILLKPPAAMKQFSTALSQWY